MHYEKITAAKRAHIFSASIKAEKHEVSRRVAAGKNIFEEIRERNHL